MLDPTFHKTDDEYEAEVAYSMESVTVTAMPTQAYAKVEVNGVEVDDDGNAEVDLDMGENSVTIKVTAEDDMVMRYYLTVTKAAASTLDPTAAKYDMTANGGNDNGRVDVPEILNAIRAYKGDPPTSTIPEILSLIRIYKGQATP
jgi:hypothetical protein